MSLPASFPFLPIHPRHGGPTLMPVLPIRLFEGPFSVDTEGIVDSGAMVSVLPYDVGLQLGLDWNKEPLQIQLAGNLATHPAKAIVLRGVVANYPSVRLSFGWSNHPTARLILGQTNFFMEFDVCIFRSQNTFQIQPRTP